MSIVGAVCNDRLTETDDGSVKLQLEEHHCSTRQLSALIWPRSFEFNNYSH